MQTLSILFALAQIWQPAINFQSLTQGVVYKDTKNPMFFQFLENKFRIGIPTGYPLAENNDVPQITGIKESCSNYSIICNKYGIYVFLINRNARKVLGENTTFNVNGVKILLKRLSNGDIIGEGYCFRIDRNGCHIPTDQNNITEYYAKYSYIVDSSSRITEIVLHYKSNSKSKESSYNLVPATKDKIKIEL